MLIKNQLKNVKGIFARNTPDVVLIIKDMIDMKKKPLGENSVYIRGKSYKCSYRTHNNLKYRRLVCFLYGFMGFFHKRKSYRFFEMLH